jgi:hypothetical protein
LARLVEKGEKVAANNVLHHSFPKLDFHDPTAGRQKLPAPLAASRPKT